MTREHILVQDNKLDDTKLVGGREVDREIECGILEIVHRGDSPFRDG